MVIPQVWITAHPLTRVLCRKLGVLLVATSANFSGLPATADSAQLDLAMIAQTDGLLLDDLRPHGGQASTVVEIVGLRRLRLVRAGAVSVSALSGSGFFHRYINWLTCYF